MDIRSELCLSLTPGVAGRLAKHLLLSEVAPVCEEVIESCYDTQDFRLQRAHVRLLCRKKGAVWLASLGRVVGGRDDEVVFAEWAAAVEPAHLDFSLVGDGRTREWLESLRDDLRPVLSRSATRNVWLLERHAGVRVELALDRGWMVHADRRQATCEIALRLLSGSVQDLFAAARELQSEFSLHPEATNSFERGYRLLAEASPQVVRALPVEIHAGMTSSAAFGVIALACLKHLQGNEQGVREADDCEFVHQARVAVRRLRSAMRIWRRRLPIDFVSSFDPRWQALAGQLGEARHWDAFLNATVPMIAAAFPEGSESSRLANYAQRRCAINREAVRSTFQSDDYSSLLLEFTAAVLALPDRNPERLDAFASACLDRRAKKAGHFLTEVLAGDAAATRRLRVSYKRLCDALLFFAPLFRGQTLLDYQFAARRLQEVIGRLNELAVAVDLTEEALPGEHGGAIRSWLEGQASELLPVLSGCLKKFQQRAVPWQEQ